MHPDFIQITVLKSQVAPLALASLQNVLGTDSVYRNYIDDYVGFLINYILKDNISRNQLVIRTVLDAKEKVLMDGKAVDDLQSVAWFLGVGAHIFIKSFYKETKVDNQPYIKLFKEIFYELWDSYFLLLHNYPSNDLKKEYSFDYFLHQSKKKHYIIVNFFTEHEFGTNLQILTYLSTLEPRDRVMILEILFNKGLRGIVFFDKLLLAYLKTGRKDIARQVVDFCKSTGQSDYRQLEYKLELTGITNRSDNERIILLNKYLDSTDNEEDIEFLELLLNFVENK